MFLYFNKQGELTTCIPHGEIPRQGNPLNVYVTLDRNFFQNKIPNTPDGWKVKISVVHSESEITEGFPADYLGLIKFKKTNDSEITYDLVNGNSYYTFWYKIPAQYSTDEYGDKKILVTLYTKKILADGSYSETETEKYNQEVYDFHVEKTFGNSSISNTISKNQYKILLERIDKLANEEQERVVLRNSTVESLITAYNKFCSGAPVMLFYDNAMMTLLSISEEENIKHLNFLLDDIFYTFMFDFNADLDTVITPKKINITENINDLIGFSRIDDVLSEAEIADLYEKMPDGRYTFKSVEYGDEIAIINHENNYFKRYTGKYDYTFDFDLGDWVIAAGGGIGGGGGGNVGNITLRHTSSASRTISVGSQDIKIQYYYKPSLGSTGFAKYYVNDILRDSRIINTGQNEFDVTKYLTLPKTYNIKVEVEDSMSNSAELIFMFNVVELNIEGFFNDSIPQEENIVINYRSLGTVEKTSHVFIDDVEKEEYSETFTDTEKTINISKLSHGVHKFEMYITAILDGEEIKSNILKYNIISIEQNNQEILISSKFDLKKATQGDVISIDFIAVDATNLSGKTTIELLINDQLTETRNVDVKKEYWTLTNYSVGENVKFTIKSKNSQKDFFMNILEAEIKIEPVKANLVLELTANRKSNASENRNEWISGSIRAELVNFNYETNGWINRENEIPFLRLNGDAKVDIPYYIFNKNFLNTGKTIEIEFKAVNVYDVNKVLISSFANNKGIIIKSNDCTFTGTSFETKTKFKENEKIKLSFVIQSSYRTRLVKTFINGIMSDLKRYSTVENLIQATPSSIVLNPDGADVDVYSIRIYDKALTNEQVLKNYISDLKPAEKKEKYNKNNIFEGQTIFETDTVDYNKVKNIIPVLIVTGPELPKTKGDKKEVRVDYVDSLHPTRNFSYENVIWDIQGTSSVNYPRKNWKGKFPKSFSFYDDAIPEDTYTFKADYMESSHSHNTGNAVFINSIAPTFPTQVDDPSVRNTIYGYPIVMFYRKSIDAEMEYQGVYNFNNDKGNANTLGLTTTKAESWEFKNHTSNRCNFLTNDFSSGVSTDFEARYPKDYTNYSALSRVVSWVYSTAIHDGDGNKLATNAELPEAITYSVEEINANGEKVTVDYTYTHDTEEYRKHKFLCEFKEYFNLDACLFYYTMMDVMLAMDSRSKNMFLDTVDGEIWYPRWYDIDTCYGLDNDGKNDFGYWLEQSDKKNENAYVFNGYKNALWNNFEIVFEKDIADYYAKLRKNGLSYESIMSVLKNKQIDSISESMYNTDGEFKYVQQLLSNDDEKVAEAEGYLYVAQGSRLNHLQWWLSNRFKYLDSKYKHPDYKEKYIYMKANVSGTDNSQTNFIITPFIKSYIHILYGSTPRFARSISGEPTEVKFSDTGEIFRPNNSEITIYGADQLIDIGDLSNKYPQPLIISAATKLKRLKLGSSEPGYKNETTTGLSLVNNVMLEELDIQNCKALTETLDMTKCTNIRKIYAKGSAIRGVILSEGGNVEELELPGTITSLEISNQPMLRKLEVESYDNLQTIKLLNVEKINTKAVVVAAKNATSVAINNIDWMLTSSEQNIVDQLYDVPVSDLSGTIKFLDVIGKKKYEKWLSKWPENSSLKIEATTVDDFVVTFYDEDKETVLQTVEVLEGQTAVYTKELPTKESVEDYGYIFYGWSENLTNISKNLDVYPIFLYERPTSFSWRIYNGELKKSISITTSEKANIEINWGDNAVTKQEGTNGGTYSHYYAAESVYNVSISITNTEEGKTGTASLTLSNDSSDKEIFIGTFYCQDRIKNITFGEWGANSKFISLTELYLPALLTSIGNYSFFENIQKTYFKGSLEQWLKLKFNYLSGINKVNNPASYSEEFYINNQLVSENVLINVESLNDYSFYNFKKIKQITFGEKVKIIGRYFCDYSEVETIIIGKNVTKIGTSAFENCSNLSTIQYNNTFYNWCKNVENGNTFNFDLQTVMMLDDEEKFYTISGENSYKIPDGIEELKNGTFYGWSTMEELIIPVSVKKFNSFIRNVSEPKLQIVYYEGSVQDWLGVEIGSSLYSPTDFCYKFMLKNSNDEFEEITELVIPGNFENLGNYQFYNIKTISKVIIETGVKNIGNYCFNNCSNIINLYIPDTLVELGTSVFYGCNELSNIYYDGNVSNWCKLYFYDEYSTPMHYASNFYVKNENGEWGLINHIDVPSDVETIGQYQFNGFRNLKTITLNNSIKKIEKRSFSNCTSLLSIDIPNSVTDIGQYAFSGCTSLINLEIPGSVMYIGQEAFNSCSNLVKVIINYGVKQLSSYVFKYCDSLVDLEIPGSVTFIGNNIVWSCASLKNIYYNGTIEEWCKCSVLESPMRTAQNFYIKNDDEEWELLTDIVIPETISKISYNNFESMNNLESITIPVTLQELGRDYINSAVFKNNYNLSNVYYEGTMEDWFKIKFWNYGATPMSYAYHFYIKNDNEEWEEVTEIIVPESLKNINNCQLYGFGNVNKVTVHDGVSIISSNALQTGASSNKTTFYFEGETPPTIQSTSFKAGNIDKIYVPSDSAVVSYSSASNWMEIANFIEVKPEEE